MLAGQEPEARVVVGVALEEHNRHRPRRHDLDSHRDQGGANATALAGGQDSQGAEDLYRHQLSRGVQDGGGEQDVSDHLTALNGNVRQAGLRREELT